MPAHALPALGRALPVTGKRPPSREQGRLRLCLPGKPSGSERGRGPRPPEGAERCAVQRAAALPGLCSQQPADGPLLLATGRC